jgi:hypothetical protein
MRSSGGNFPETSAGPGEGGANLLELERDIPLSFRFEIEAFVWHSLESEAYSPLSPINMLSF